MSEDTRLFLFVYAKDGKVRVLTHDEACGNEVRMKQDRRPAGSSDTLMA